MSTRSELASREQVSPRRLWFGFLATSLCWVGLGIADVLITWRECLHFEQYGGASKHPGMYALSLAIFAALLLIAVISGIMSYHNFRRISGNQDIMRAEAEGAREYFALLGVFVCVTMGIGVIWLGLPLLLISLCARVR